MLGSCFDAGSDCIDSLGWQVAYWGSASASVVVVVVHRYRNQTAVVLEAGRTGSVDADPPSVGALQELEIAEVPYAVVGVSGKYDRPGYPVYVDD